MSRYSIIWESLKSQIASKSLGVGVKIASPIGLHKRVIKGVIRTKDEDVFFKFEVAQKAKKYRLTYKRTESMIHFHLLEFDDIKNL